MHKFKSRIALCYVFLVPIKSGVVQKQARNFPSSTPSPSRVNNTPLISPRYFEFHHVCKKTESCIAQSVMRYGRANNLNESTVFCSMETKTPTIEGTTIQQYPCCSRLELLSSNASSQSNNPSLVKFEKIISSS